MAGMKSRATILKTIECLMEDRIEKKKAGTDEIGEADLLGFILEQSNLDAGQFGDLLLGLLFGGHETSSTAITLAVYFLEQCPKAVQQLRGWSVIPVFAAAHLDPTVYESPQKFDLSLLFFKTISSSTARIDNYMPFGQGLRNCAGLELAKMEIAVFLHHLVLNFDWELAEPDHPLAYAFPEFDKGLPIKVRKLSILYRTCKEVSFDWYQSLVHIHKMLQLIRFIGSQSQPSMKSMKTLNQGM